MYTTPERSPLVKRDPKKWPQVRPLAGWVAEIEARPPPPWFIEGWIPQGAITYVSGPAKLGNKTFTATLLALIMATRTPLGPWLPREPARILAVYKEGIEVGTATMIHAICRMLGAPVPDAPAFNIVHSPPLQLDQDTDVKWLHEQIAATGANIVLLDTLYSMISGDENKQEDANKVVQTLFKLREKNIATIVVCHAKKGVSKQTDPDERIRGSSVFAGSYDVHFPLWRNRSQDWQDMQFRSRYAPESDWRQYWTITGDKKTGRIASVDYKIVQAVSKVDEYAEQLSKATKRKKKNEK